MASVEVTITSLLDAFPYLKKTSYRKYMTIIGIVLLDYLCGIILTTKSGTYWYMCI